MVQRDLALRRIVRLIAAIGTILALMLAGGAPSEFVDSSSFFIELGN